MYKMIADLHTHTLSSTHAYDTFDAMTKMAAEIGYRALAITDHAPSMPDAPHIWHFQNLDSMSRMMNGVALLQGAEVNVMDTFGGLDLPQTLLAGLDWVVASIHSPCVPGTLSRKEANRLWLAIAENPYVDSIGHSEQENYRYDYDFVTKVFAKNNKVVELNGNSFNARKDGVPNMKPLLRACMNSGCKIALDSDAHSVDMLRGGMQRLYQMLEEVNFPQELIVNASCENLVEELKVHHRKVAAELGGLLL